MPKEYIEREAAIEAIMSEPPDAHYPQWYVDKIKSIPAADVARRGMGGGRSAVVNGNAPIVKCL